jgi:thioredoxin reductase (NADPH)
MIHKEIPDYPGLWCENGAVLAAKMQEHVERLKGIRILVGEVEEIDAESGALRWRDGGGGVHESKAGALVMATGLARRPLETPDLRGWLDRGVAYSASEDPRIFARRSVCVIGGGDGAMENALWLVEACGCPSVSLVHRGRSLRGRRDFIERVMEHPQIRVILGSLLVACESEEEGGRLTAVRIETPQGEERLAAEALLIKIGFAPQTQLLRGKSEMDAQGYLWVDAHQKTSAGRLWAVGDLCTPVDPSISVAVGQGCLAAREIARFLAR